MSVTTADLIQSVKRRETIPDSGVAFDDATLLEYLDTALKGFIVPAIESVLEEHFVVTSDYQMGLISQSSSVPTDVNNFLEIPGESTGLRLRDVYVVGSDGQFFNLPRLTPTQAASQNYGYGNTSIAQFGMVGGFYLQGNTLQIFPYALASNKTIRITYQRAPADLCLISEAAQVISIVGDTLTLSTVPSPQWFSGITKVNVISNDLPHDYVKDATVPVTVYTSYTPLSNVLLVSAVGNVIVLPLGTGANVKVGDWVCPAGKSTLCQNIPRELIPVLTQKAAEICLEAAGDREGQDKANETFKSMMSMALLQIAPRVTGKPVIIRNNNSAFNASRRSFVGRR
jgi:hypothetical protein